MRQPDVRMGRLFRTGQSFINQRLKSIGLSSGLFNFIVELGQRDGLSLSELSSAVQVNGAHTTRAIRRLVDLGYVRKVPDEMDGRGFRVYLTKSGREAEKRVMEVVQSWIDLVTENVSSDDLAALVRILGQLNTNATKSRQAQS